VRRGEIYRSEHPEPERGGKPGYYVVVSRDLVAAHDAIETVVCAPVYGAVLGIPTEVLVDEAQGLRKRSAIRCDFLTLMSKRRLTQFAGSLPVAKIRELDRALAIALDLNLSQ
jgi:mRNA interferase MazF